MKTISKLMFLFLVCLLMLPISVFGDETKWIAVGMLRDWFSSGGCEIEVGRRHLTQDQQDGLQWPALFKWQDCKAAKALWIGTTDYDDPLSGIKFDAKVVHAGPRVLDEANEFMPQVFKMIGRFNHPQVYVDGVPAGKLDFLDDVDEVDENLISDRMIYNVVNTALGITEKRKIYAFSQQNHDNYYIYDYVFKNTGIIDIEGTVVQQTLEGVYFHFQYRYSPCKEPCAYGYYWLPQSFTWGHVTMNDARNEAPLSLDPLTWPEPNDPPRSLFSWQGLHSKATFNTIGGPYGGEGGDGRLGAAQYTGVITLHADKSPSDPSDDPYQPTTTQYIQSDERILSDNDQFKADQMAEEYELMSAGHPPIRHAADVGCPIPTDCDAYGDTYVYAGTKGSNPGGYTHCHGFGPYTLAPGDSIHLVIAEAANGLSRDSCVSIGAKWYAGEGPFELPDGSTTDDPDLYKNAWVYTGQDSIFKTFFRISDRWEEYEATGNFSIPQAPPPPEIFEINSGGDRISLKWSDNAESWPTFEGYKIYRTVHTPDTTYDLIFSCSKTEGNIVHEFDDKQPIRGFDYYYYITSYDDGSQNDIFPGMPLESSIFYTMSNEPAYLRRPPGDRLKDIRVVPNPYNIRAEELQYGRSAPDRIMFIDIPPYCDIKIFTERGDLINTIVHDNGTGDEAWNLVTSSRQVIVSGIYIVVFEVTEDFNDPASGDLLYQKGDKAIRKFIVIR